MSQREAWEYAKLEEVVEFDPVSRTSRVKYLSTDDPRKLTNNLKLVKRMAETIKKRLERDGLTEKYKLVQRAKLALQAKRYDDMAASMKSVTEAGVEL
jgi:hypothetical protein